MHVTRSASLHFASAALMQALNPQPSSSNALVLVDPAMDVDEETTLRPVDTRAIQAAARTGAEHTQVERLPFDLSALESGGVFANVDASGFGVLDRRIDWRALGVALPRRADFAFHPPRHGLVPDRYRLPLLRPADRAHSALHRYSYHFRLVEAVLETSAYQWLPWRAWPEFERRFEVERGRLTAALHAYEADYMLIRQQAQETFGRLANDSACRLESTGQPVPAGFQDALVRDLIHALPDPDQLRERLVLRYRIGVFHFGSEFLAEQRQAAEERRRLEVAQSELRLELVRQDTQRQLVQEQLWAERDRLRARAHAEDDERRREAEVKERLRQLKLEAARERLQDTLSPLEEGARQLHATVFEAAVAIRESLRKNRALHGSSARRVRDLAQWFTVMNWTDDRQLEALVGELEGLAKRPTSKKRKRDPGPIDSVLSDIIALTYDNARAALEPSRMAALEL